MYKMINENEELFNKKLVNKFKYTFEEIEEVLDQNDKILENEFYANQKKINYITSENINTLDDLRIFYKNELEKLYDNTLDKATKDSIFKSLSLKELNRLHSIISNVSLSKNATKKEIIDMMRYYFNDESRTDSLVKTM